MYDEYKARTKFYPRRLSILDANANAALNEQGSTCHDESTTKLNNCPRFS